MHWVTAELSEQVDRQYADVSRLIVESSSKDFPRTVVRYSRTRPIDCSSVAMSMRCTCRRSPSLAAAIPPSRDGATRSNSQEHLGGAGFCIVSGLAQGIDAAAHEGALAAGAMTVACLGHGIDQVYPVSNAALAERIVANQGALCYRISGRRRAPRREHFPQRNRLISGLALGLTRRRGRPAQRFADYGQAGWRTGTGNICDTRLDT